MHPPVRSRLIVVGDVLNVEYVLTVTAAQAISRFTVKVGVPF